MKHAITTIFIVLLGLISTIANAENDKTKLTTQNEILSGIPDTEIFRDLTYRVDAYLLSTENIIEINYHGIGDANVYIINSHNQIIEETILYEGSFCSIIEAPTTTGRYYLIICSDKYYGEFVLNIY